MQNTPRRCIILIEDIDKYAFTGSYYPMERLDHTGVTLPGLLNVIDGAVGGEGRM